MPLTAHVTLKFFTTVCTQDTHIATVYLLRNKTVDMLGIFPVVSWKQQSHCSGFRALKVQHHFLQQGVVAVLRSRPAKNVKSP